jgi:transcriptional regulator of acetoin/glycerol metabolism
VLPIVATQPIRVDFRVVAATHRPLDELAAGEQFRHDLLARLAGFRVQLRPLRERREDLGLLVGEMLRAHGAEGAPIRVAAWRALLAAPWPANVRELEHALGRALLRRTSDGALAFEITGTPPRASDAERDRLVTSMRRHGGNIAAVARELGKARMQVQRWLRRYEIDPDTFRRS